MSEDRTLGRCHRCGCRKQMRNLPMVELLIVDLTFLRVQMCRPCFHLIETMFFPLVLSRVFRKKVSSDPDQASFLEDKK